MPGLTLGGSSSALGGPGAIGGLGTPPVAFQPADVVFGSSTGVIEHRRSSGTLVRILYPLGTGEVWGLSWSGSGELYALLGDDGSGTGTTTIEKWGADGVSVGAFGDSSFYGASAIPNDLVVLDDDSYLVLVKAVDHLELWRFDQTGTRTDVWTVDADDEYFDSGEQAKLDCRGETVVYADQSLTLFSFDLSTGAQGPVIASPPDDDVFRFDAPRFISGGDVVVAMTSLHGAGGMGPLHSVTPSGDGVWADFHGDGSRADRYRLSDGEPVGSLVTTLPTDARILSMEVISPPKPTLVTWASATPP